MLSISKTLTKTCNILITKHLSTIKVNKLAALDFDLTITARDTTEEILKLIPNYNPAKWNDILEGGGWIYYLTGIFNLLHKHKVNKTQIYDLISRIPETEGMTELLTYLNENNYEVIIISDSTQVLIENWLDSHKLRKYIKTILTNPSYYDVYGRLQILGHQSQEKCQLCPRNMCKGSVLVKYLEERTEGAANFKRVIYVGDGINDFCPMLRLRKQDIAFPKLAHPIFRRIDGQKDPDLLIKAHIRPWLSGYDVLKGVKE